MDISFQDIINTIFYLGSVQGVLLTFLLFKIKTNSISNHLLGILTFLWAIILLLFALQSHGINLRYPHLLNTFSELLFAWFPLLYLSVKYLIINHSRFNLKDLLHFIPMLFSILLLMDFYTKSGAEKLQLVSEPTGFYFIVNMINEEMLSIQGVVYSIIILIILRNYKERAVDFHANINQKILNWMRIGVILILVAWILGITGTIVERAQIDIHIDLFLFVYLLFVIIIYGISFIALRSKEVYKLEFEQIRELVSIDHHMPDLKAKPAQRSFSGDDRQLSRHEEEFENELNDRLISFMENSRPYLDPDLSLQSLAETLFVSRHQLSATINSKQNKNFFEFVNLYRVKEVKELMMKDINQRMKNYELAYEAGFNSKATFYRIFKQISGQTPSAFREAIKGSG